MSYEEFEMIFKRHYTVLYRYATLLVNNKAIAEDIVQDQFACLWENRHRIKINSYEAYLFKAVKNKSINYLKSSFNKNRQEFTEIIKNSQITDETNQRIDETELQIIIQKALEQLPAKCYSVFYLKRFEELSYKEIAEKLSISEKTVENQMTIAIRKIAYFINKFWN